MSPKLYEFSVDLDRSLNTNEEIIDFDPIPVVFVEGFMGLGKPDYWGPLEKLFASSDNDDDENNQEQKSKSRRCIFVTPGCGSSLHDRAIEIFYQIKGGRGNYQRFINLFSAPH